MEMIPFLFSNYETKLMSFYNTSIISIQILIPSGPVDVEENTLAFVKAKIHAEKVTLKECLKKGFRSGKIYEVINSK